METIDKVIYTGKTLASGNGRDGNVRSSDGRLNLALSHFNSKGEGTNPEQLLAAGWSACYFSALRILAKEAKVEVPADATVDTEVDLGMSGAGYALQARLTVALPGVPRDVAQALADKAHTICPYSKALHGSIGITTQVA